MDPNERLYNAVRESKLEDVKNLLDSGVNPNIENTQGKTPLYWAAYTKNNKIANWLKIYIEDALMPGSTTWSTQWTYAMIKNNGLTIVPPKNLVENIGFTGPSTHGQSKSWKHYSSFKANTINNYKCPEFIYPNLFLDKLRYKLIRKTDPNLFLISKLKRFVKNILIKKINLFN